MIKITKYTYSIILLLTTFISTFALAAEYQMTELDKDLSLDYLKNSASLIFVSVSPISTEQVNPLKNSQSVLNNIFITDDTKCILTPKFEADSSIKTQDELQNFQINKNYSTSSSRPSSHFKNGVSILASLISSKYLIYNYFEIDLLEDTQGEKLRLFCISNNFYDLPKYYQFKDAFNKIGIDFTVSYLNK